MKNFISISPHSLDDDIWLNTSYRLVCLICKKMLITVLNDIRATFRIYKSRFFPWHAHLIYTSDNLVENLPVAGGGTSQVQVSDWLICNYDGQSYTLSES